MPLTLTYKGFNYVDPGKDAYADDDSLPQVAATGADSVALTPDYGIDVADSSVYATGDGTDSPADLTLAINEASANGMTAFVRPLIDFYYSQASTSLPGSYYVGSYNDPNNVPPGVTPATVPPGAPTTMYRGYLQPADLNLPAFFKSYDSMIVSEAKVAQSAGAKLFAVGTELDSLADDTNPVVEADWTNLISQVRAVYSGKLTYSSNWANADQVTFWNKLDLVGIDGYVPLSNTIPNSAAHNPSVAALMKGWTAPSDVAVGNTTVGQIFDGMSAVDFYDKLAQQSIDKQFVFSEVGYPNDTSAAEDPTGNSETGVADPALQSRLCTAFFDAWGQAQQTAAGNGGMVDGQPFSLAGAYFYDWYPNSTSPSGDSFALDNTAASDAIAAGFAGDPIPCFASGTRIRTVRARQTGSVADVSFQDVIFKDVIFEDAVFEEVVVEDLAVGDLVVTASGGKRTIRWIGHREVDCTSHAIKTDVWPIRIRAGAFGSDLPERDLFLSPGHPVLVGEGDGEHLVPITCLVNGTTIVRVPVQRVTYWHIELDAHDILLAEGLPAESFLDFGNRAWFGPEAEAHALANPDLVVPGLAARCRPVATDGPVVETERRRLGALFETDLAAQSQWPAIDHDTIGAAAVWAHL